MPGMSDRVGLYTAVLVIVGIFLAIQVGALALVEPFMEAEQQPVENPQDPTNSVVFFGLLLVATAMMLAVIKYGQRNWIRLFVVAATGGLGWFVTSVFLTPLAELEAGTVVGQVGSIAAFVLPVGVGLAIVAGLLYHPEWYVIDGAGIIMGAGSGALFGISFSPFPAILFLLVLAVYDAISVYGTEHMLTLAEGVVDLKIPVLLVVPTSRSYSFLDAETPASLQDDETGVDRADIESSFPDSAADGTTDGSTEIGTDDNDAGSERGALLIGLGDAVMPTILVASAAVFRSDVGPIAVPGITLTLPAIGAMIGTIAGLLLLQWLVLKGRAHAGLPLLNGGAIVGYLIGAMASGLTLTEAIGV
jgi:presenilin-like A22 family membrane protease